jgi:hypothetical protein
MSDCLFAGTDHELKVWDVLDGDNVNGAECDNKR